MYNEATCVYVTEELFMPIDAPALNITTNHSGRCAACTAGYHAGEQVVIDTEMRIVHWECHLREARQGGHLMAIARMEQRNRDTTNLA